MSALLKVILLILISTTSPSASIFQDKVSPLIFNNTTFQIGYAQENERYDKEIDRKIALNFRQSSGKMPPKINNSNDLYHQFGELQNKIGAGKYLYLDDLNIQMNFEGYTLKLTFGPCGGNSIFALKDLLIEDENGPHQRKITTDFVGPYIVHQTKSNETSSDIAQKEAFTGGWHSINQKPTAKTVKVSIKNDFLALDKKSLGYFTNLTIVVTNEIKAYNTLEYVLTEQVTYTIHDNSIDIRVVTTANAAVSISRYYGLQTQNRLFSRGVTYQYEDGSMDEMKQSLSTASKLKSANRPVESIRLNTKDKKYELTAWLDLSSQLGGYAYLSEDKPYAFTSEFGKSYFSLIYGKSMDLKFGESLSWHGEYKINRISQ